MEDELLRRRSHGSLRIGDEDRLAELGYRQELKRNWTLLHNFGVSFSIISVITGITTLFGYGLSTGGPGVMSVGWIVVSFFTIIVALGMAEIVSAVPTSGGPYFWAATLAPSNQAAFYSWVTGWFNFLGQVAVTTGIDFGNAGLISTTATIKSAYTPTAGRTIGIYAALLVSHALVNSFGVKFLRYLNNTSIVLHSIGISCFAIALLAKAPTHRSAKEVFATFYDGTGQDPAPGWSVRASPAYVAVCGILMAQYTITGFDASAHLSEETANAAWSAPLGVLMSVGVSSVFGFFLILSLLFSIQDFTSTVSSDVGQPVTQILLDVFGENGAIALMTLIIVCVWHCGLFSMTSNSRMMFGFARDRGLPHFFAHVDHRFAAPIRTICLAAFLSFLLAIPSLGSAVAFSAATSIATIGLYLSYGIPILIGLLYPSNFTKGPFNLRFLSRPIALVGVMYILFITIVFCLPQQNPVDSQTLNYTPVAVGIVALWAFGSWFLWARRWFTGPVRQIEEERLGVPMEEPGAVARHEQSLYEKDGSMRMENLDGRSLEVKGL
ncbi:polyamine transporter tpo5 [Lecanora helva]